MLTTLKNTIKGDIDFKSSLEAAVENISDDEIEETFLDDPDAMVIGAENDPKIEELVESLPEDANEETNEVDEKDIDELVENYIPESKLSEAVDGSAEDGDSGDDDTNYDKELDAAAENVDEIDNINDDEFTDIEECDIDVFESACDNILGTEQRSIEDSDDEAMHSDNSEYENILGGDQDDIEDYDDDETMKPDNSEFDNILGTKQTDIADIKEAFEFGNEII